MKDKVELNSEYFLGYFALNEPLPAEALAIRTKGIAQAPSLWLCKRHDQPNTAFTCCAKAASSLDPQVAIYPSIIQAVCMKA